MFIVLQIALLLGIAYQTTSHEDKQTLINQGTMIQYLLNKDQENSQSISNIESNIEELKSNQQCIQGNLTKTQNSLDVISGTEVNFEYFSDQISSIKFQLNELAKDSQLGELNSLKETAQTFGNLIVQLEEEQNKQFKSLENVKTGLEDKQTQIQTLNTQINNQAQSLGDLKNNLGNPMCPEGMVMVGSDQNAFCIHPEAVGIAMSYLESQEFCLNQGFKMCSVAQTQSAIRLHKLKTTSFHRENIWYMCSDVDHDGYSCTQGSFDEAAHPLYDVIIVGFQAKHHWQRTVCCSEVTFQI